MDNQNLPAKVANFCFKKKLNDGFLKIAFSDSEECIIKGLYSTLEAIAKDCNTKPNIYTFYSNYLTCNTVMRAIKYGIQSDSIPMKKYAMVDMKAQLGHYNDLFEILNYLGISSIKKIDFKIENILMDLKTKEKNNLKIFHSYVLEKILGIAELTKKYLECTYGSDFRRNVVVDIETQADLNKKELFLEKHKEYSEKTSEEIEELMSRNPLYNKMYSFSIFYLN